MADNLAQARHQLATANRILAHEGIIDAFGHVSMRHPTDPNRYLISKSRSPEVVEAADIYEYTLDSKLVSPMRPGDEGYGELVIHGEIYKARPDVNAISHHHGMALIPFCNLGKPPKAVYHMGGLLGGDVSFWDSRDEFGDTSLLVIEPAEGASLAKALGANWLVLMRRHGTTVAGCNVTELTFRTIYTYRNAQAQLMTEALGEISPLTPGEMVKAQERNLRPKATGRAWEYWCTRLKKAGEFPAPLKAAKAKAAKSGKSSAGKRGKRR